MRLGRRRVRDRVEEPSIRDRADAARDVRDFHRAVQLYEEHLRTAPDDAAIHIQCGHMHKEAGDLVRAQQHYLRAKALTPDDPDLALQFGHFYKVAGRLHEAELAYRRAAELNPESTQPLIELAGMYRAGWRNHTTVSNYYDRRETLANDSAVLDAVIPAFETVRVPRFEGLVPEIAPQAPESRLFGHSDEIKILRLGSWERTPWGMRNTIHGVDAIRAFCISATPIVEVRAFLNGMRIFAVKPQEFLLKYEKYDKYRKKYVFNSWYDYCNFREGLYDLDLRFLDADGGLRVHSEQIVIANPFGEQDYPHSDRLVAILPGDGRSIEDQVNSRPSMIRRAKRAPFTGPPRNVLIQRVDQVGDLVVSVPALRRLRELLPKARLVGLLSFANAELAKSLHLFDEIIAIDFVDDEWERKRVMPLDEQQALRRRLEPFKFDIAIDLASSNPSRPLLLLSGARYLVGFKDDQCPWLSAALKALREIQWVRVLRFPIRGKYWALSSGLARSWATAVKL